MLRKFILESLYISEVLLVWMWTPKGNGGSRTRISKTELVWFPYFYIRRSTLHCQADSSDWDSLVFHSLQMAGGSLGGKIRFGAGMDATTRKEMALEHYWGSLGWMRLSERRGFYWGENMGEVELVSLGVPRPMPIWSALGLSPNKEFSEGIRGRFHCAGEPDLALW